MKTKIHGYDVECTMAEFLQYIEWKSRDTVLCNTVTPPSPPPQIKTGRFVVNGEIRGKTSPMAVVVEMHGTSIRANSIREAQRIAGIPFGSFSLSKALREHDGSVTVNGIKFTSEQYSDKCEPVPDDTEILKTAIKINKPKRKQLLTYKLIYPNGDNRLINLKAFCKDNEMDYNNACYKISKYGELNVGQYIIKHK